MKQSIAKKLAQRNRRRLQRLKRANQIKYRKAGETAPPELAQGGLKYELSGKTQGIVQGGIPLMVTLAQQLGLVDAIDRKLHLLKVHLPYHESDHVLNLALNALCGGTSLEDIELRRNDENYLNALGADAIPDPTTAGDFCRRFTESDIDDLQDAIDEARINAWQGQPESFFQEALIDADGTLVETTGQTKVGMDLSYKGVWGYHPLLITLSNTGEVMRLFNRSGNRPSEEGAADYTNEAIEVCRRGGFRKIRLRGDTAFSQTEYLDGWDADGVTFQFGYKAAQNLVEIAEHLDPSLWRELERPATYRRIGSPRTKPENIKEQIVKTRGYENLQLESEHVAEFDYRPARCKQSYRMIVVRKNLTKEKGEQRLFDEIRYLFYISNDRKTSAAGIVYGCNDRCNQENLIAQLAALRALHAPVDNLTSNWAYMLMTSLAWTLKAWMALQVPVDGRWKEKHATERETILRMEFKTFLNHLIQIPCQVIHQARRRILKVLNWNPWLTVFFRLSNVLRL